jgi:glyoxalase family protein
MIPTIQHLHHVTATVADAQPDLDFYTGLLGLRLVKKTVNFDNHFVYHFYYGDERGTPGTIMTTFPYAGTGVPVGRKGTGQITATAFSVPAGSLDRWRTRLEQHSIAVLTDGTRFGDRWLGFLDPSSLVIELIESASDARQPWTGSRVDPAIAIRGVHSVSLTLTDPERSAAFLTDCLGFTVGKTEGNRTRASVGGGGAGHSLDLVRDPGAPPAINGLGTVHHVAMAIGTMEEQLAAREMLLEAGLAVTEVRDRQYFTSIYFREPGGVLYEIATLGPGFAVDEPLSGLGRALKLPPWEEPHRSVIEPRLAPISQP